MYNKSIFTGLHKQSCEKFFIKRIDNADFNNHVVSLSDLNKNKEELTKTQAFTAFDEISSKFLVHHMQKVLTQREFKTIYLIFYVGYTVREISSYLQVSVQKVKSMVWKCSIYLLQKVYEQY